MQDHIRSQRTIKIQIFTCWLLSAPTRNINNFLYIWSKLKVFDSLGTENNSYFETEGVYSKTYESRKAKIYYNLE